MIANAVTAFLDDRLAAGNGGSPAVVTARATTTYAELLALANRAGQGLRAFGVEPEQRVAVLLPDGLAWVATFFGALRIGAVAVPFNTRLGGTEWTEMLLDSRAKVLVADATVVRVLAGHRNELPHLRAIVDFGELIAGAKDELAPEPVGLDAMAFWLYTSGTTGAAKAAVHLHRDLLAGRHYGDDVLAANATDRVFATSKLFFAYALGNALLIPFSVGAQTYLSPGWAEPDAVAEIAACFRPTLLFSVPTFYGRLLRAGLPADTFTSVRCAVSAGERLPAEIGLAFRERFGVEILDGMGATETVFMVLSNRRGRSRPGSSGTPVPGAEARVLDADGRDVPDGVEGVLYVRAPSTSPFYWNRLDQSRRAFVGEWFRTGDVYVRDADGFYHHRGREDDRFKVAGMWVAPADVERALCAHPAVADAGVVGAADEHGLVKPFAFVVAKEPATAADLASDLGRIAEAELPVHQRPRRIFVVPELPRTATGKLQRFRLRELVR
ncbi:MAG: hypothetical protein AUH30_11185 [Candidatus Rokubacteria bacterium 13_1_40CM_68_15]|nr:MAG: hypothetical protein AUH30_11185 [Candidatus Rokubacteria bacterium 13_1_40CM_68_15]